MIAFIVSWFIFAAQTGKKLGNHAIRSLMIH